jgi:hypothetical protein
MHTINPSVQPPEAFFQGMNGEQYAVPYLEDVRHQPWLPEGIRDALDPARATEYMIGHKTVDAAIESILVTTLEEDMAVALPQALNPYPLPNLMQNILEGRPLDPAEQIPVLPIDARYFYLDTITELNIPLFLARTARRGPLTNDNPFYPVLRSVIPTRSGQPADKLALHEVWDFMQSQNAEITPEALLRRFDHYVQLSNFLRGKLLTQLMVDVDQKEKGDRRLRDLPKFASTYLELNNANFFQEDYLIGRETLGTFRRHLLVQGNHLAGRTEYVKLARNLGQFESEMQNAIIGFVPAFRRMDAPYPPLLETALPPSARRKAATAKPAPAPPNARESVVDPEVKAELLAASNNLNKEVDSLTTAWTLTRKERERARLPALSRQLQAGVYREGRELLTPIVDTRADGLVNFIHRLRNRIERTGPEKALATLLTAFQHQADLSAATRQERSRAEVAGLASTEIKYQQPPELQAFFGYLADPEQWRYIQELIRDHENSNDTINAINQCLEAYRAQRESEPS